VTASIAPEPIGAADRHLARYVRRTVYPYSAYYRGVLDAIGGGGVVRSRADLRRVPPTDLASISDPAQLVLRPDLGSIVRQGDRTLAARVVMAKAVGGMHGLNQRVVEHRFKPVHWILGDGIPLGYSSHDLVTLGTLGKAWLGVAGVHHGDVLVSLVPPGPTVAYWEVVLGSRRANVAAMHLDPDSDPATIAGVAPTVLAGDPRHLLALLGRAAAAGHGFPNVRTILAVGAPLGTDLRQQLRAQVPGAAVVGAWAPSGVRALWTECRLGAGRPEPVGYHALGDEVLELDAGNNGAAPGELLWTGIGWQGSALLRLRTYTTAGLEGGACPACGRNGPRVVPLAPVRRAAAIPAVAPPPVAAPPAPPLPAAVGPAAPPPPVAADGGARLAGVLDAESDVQSWQVERRLVGGVEETIVVIAPAWGVAVVPLVRRLNRHLRATQFIVLPVEEVTARVAGAGGRRIVDEPQIPGGR